MEDDNLNGWNQPDANMIPGWWLSPTLVVNILLIMINIWLYYMVDDGQYDTWLVVYLPLWKMMEFVSWDDDIPNWMEKSNMFQTTQPDTCGRKLFTRRVEDPLNSGAHFSPIKNQLGYIVNVWVPIIHGLTMLSMRTKPSKGPGKPGELLYSLYGVFMEHKTILYPLVN